MDAQPPESEARHGSVMGLDAANAHLGGWLALALVNQVVIPFMLPGAPGQTRLIHHAVDAGQLLALGALSWLGLRGLSWATRRAPISLQGRAWQALMLALAVLLVGLLTASDDVSNLAERLDSPQWLLTLGLAHGEGFGEHGTFNHARTVYEELVRVPLFIYAPGRPGRELDVQASGMDIGATILDLFGLPQPGFWMGQSLLPAVAGKSLRLERPLALDTGRRQQALCFDDGYKVIFSRLQHTTEVYDLKRDPGELHNLADSGDPRAREVIDIGEYFFASIALNDSGYEIPEHKF